MGDLFLGATYFFRGLSLLGQPSIRRYAFLPMAIAAILFAALIWVATLYVQDAADWFSERLPDWLAWLEWLLWIVFALLCAGVLVFTFVLVAATVAAPFNGMLSDAVEVHLTGASAPSDPFGKMLRKLPGTMFQEVKKILYSVLLALPFLILFLVPIAQLAAPVLWFLFCAWITAFSFADYPMSNHGKTLAEIRSTLRRRRLLALGFGSVCFVCLAIPLLNLFALPAAVSGGTVLWVEQLRGGDDPVAAPAG